jgi:hypothetical protein
MCPSGYVGSFAPKGVAFGPLGRKRLALVWALALIGWLCFALLSASLLLALSCSSLRSRINYAPLRYAMFDLLRTRSARTAPCLAALNYVARSLRSLLLRIYRCAQYTALRYRSLLVALTCSYVARKLA